MVKELVKPTPAQVRWQNAEFGMFVHFGINTFNNREWSDGTKSPKTFNPKRLNTDQWIQVAKNAGVNYMILTCKHHDGFCLWQTETTDYSVKSSPYKQGKGDVVDEFVASCRKFGMKFGFYLSPWDRHEPCYKDKEAYDKFYAKQLNELLTKYAEHDELFEIWFDGAGSAGREYDWKSIIEIGRASCRERV
jgi:alpha-L-fucosidase